MTSALFSIRTYQVVFILLLGALLITFFQRAAYFDEAWFAEQSFWLIHDGRVRSELFRGYIGWENGLYVFHKLFIYAGALLMSITGVSVASSKLVSIGFSLLGGYLIWWYGKNTSREQQWLSILLYFGCGTLIRYSSVNRPETMCMALGFASYLGLETPGVSTRPKPVLAGVLGGLAALTHLNGLIYLAAGVGWLFIKTGWRPTLPFAVSGALTLSLYGIDALIDGHLTVMANQFFDDPATQQNLHLGDKLSVLANYHQIFFHSQNEGALTVLAILSGIAFRKKITYTQPVFLYAVLLILSFWALTKSDTDIYFLLFVPWLCLLAANWLVAYLATQAVYPKRIGQVLLVCYSIVAVIQIREVLLENKTTPDIESRNVLLASHMPQHHSKVIAPIDFFFGQMNNYQIQGLTYYYLREQAGEKIPLSMFFRLAEQANVMYIISSYGRDASYAIPADAPARIGPYRRVFQDHWNAVYARQ